eukprot:9616334-Lingulodinium_polyedra.AAC.1
MGTRVVVARAVPRPDVTDGGVVRGNNRVARRGRTAPTGNNSIDAAGVAVVDTGARIGKQYCAMG